MPDSSQDFRNKVLGRQAEKLTCTFLKRRGYAIVERNFVTPYGEADIIAKSGDGTYCFVEVKARTGNPLITPAAAVTPPVRAPSTPCSATALATPLDSSQPKPVRGTVAPAPPNWAIYG